MKSRRRLYSAHSSWTNLCGPVSASTAPACAKLVGHCVLWEMRAVQASTSGFGPSTHPIRQPVMQ